jgi:hypothetical protein
VSLCIPGTWIADPLDRKQTADPLDQWDCVVEWNCRASRHSYFWPSQLHTEPEFLIIYWRLKSRLFKKSCLFKGQWVQQGSNSFCALMEKSIFCKLNKRMRAVQIIRPAYYIENVIRVIWNPSFHFKVFKKSGSEPKFLKILKCNSAESTSAGFQFIYFGIFNG